MKYIIIGLHSSGKQSVAEELKLLGNRVGQTFRSVKSLPSNTYSLSSIFYTNEDITNIFESQSYLFIKNYMKNGAVYFEGISMYEYENNDVFLMTPEQFNTVPNFDADTCFIWLDNDQGTRFSDYNLNDLKYDFFEEEHIESKDLKDFLDRIYDYNILYFNNENPERVAAIIHSLITYPELFEIYNKRFK